MRLGHPGCQSLRPRIEPPDDVRAGAAGRPHRVPDGEEKPDWTVRELDGLDDGVRRGIDAHELVRVRHGNPNAERHRDQAHVPGTAGPLRTDAYRCDDAIRHGVDARDTRPAVVCDPHAVPRDRDPRRLRPCGDPRRHLVGRRIDARDRVVRWMGEPDCAVAGGDRLRRRNLDPGPDRIPGRIDPQQHRPSIGHGPHCTFARGQRPASERCDSASHETNPRDHLGAGGDRPRPRCDYLRASRPARRRCRAIAHVRDRARGKAADPHGVARRRDREVGGVAGSRSDSDRSPDALSRAHVDPRDGPALGIANEQIMAGAREGGRCAADVDRLPDGLERSWIEPADPPALAVDEPDASGGNRDPGRETSDSHALDGETRGIDPKNRPVVWRRDPHVPAVDREPEPASLGEAKRRILRRQRQRIETEQHRRP